MNPKSIILLPRVSEKTYELSQEHNTYSFIVPKSANKQVVAKAVSEQFKVTVNAVRIANQQGKVKRTVRKGGRAVKGQRSDYKKAYVVLKVGDSLPIFSTEDEKPKSENIKEKK